MLTVYLDKDSHSDIELRQLFGRKGYGAVLTKIREDLGNIIAQHVVGIMEERFADRLHPEDFFHGHCIVARNPDAEGIYEYSKDEGAWIELFMESRPLVLYHTREMVERVPYRGPPRSIAGTIDGKVHPARSNEDVFQSHGTVFGYDPFEFNGQKYPRHHKMPNFFVTFDGERESAVGAQFYILKNKDGRYRLPNGIKFDLFHEVPIDKNVIVIP